MISERPGLILLRVFKQGGPSDENNGIDNLMMRDNAFISFSNSPGALDLTTARILVDEADHEGIKIAANILSRDLSRVTRTSPTGISHYSGYEYAVGAGSVALIIGCVDSSRLLADLEQAGKVAFASIRGKWESFCTSVLDDPLQGCGGALVIAGSDKRGTIYGIYALAEEIGVSP